MSWPNWNSTVFHCGRSEFLCLAESKQCLTKLIVVATKLEIWLTGIRQGLVGSVSEIKWCVCVCMCVCARVRACVSVALHHIQQVDLYTANYLPYPTSMCQEHSRENAPLLTLIKRTMLVVDWAFDIKVGIRMDGWMSWEPTSFLSMVKEFEIHCSNYFRVKPIG